jgi:class 3 adenylate cyclase
MAIGVRERMAEHFEKWEKRGHTLGFGAGIAMGHATLGRIGFEGRYDYGAVGNVTNLAQRLSAEAKAGQILVSQRIFALKGYARPVTAYRVMRLRALVRPTVD